MRIGAVTLVVAVAAGLWSSQGEEVQVAGSLMSDSIAPESMIVALADTKPPVVAPPKPVNSPPPKAPAKKVAPKADVPLAPLVAPGRTEVGDGLYIEREGELVTVHFDTPQTRTRRRDKFERVVRRTLPEVYGSAAEAILSSIPEGALVDPVDLVTEIAERGLELDAGDGWKVELWPETRPGQDGPLVVSYRVAVTR